MGLFKILDTLLNDDFMKYRQKPISTECQHVKTHSKHTFTHTVEYQHRRDFYQKPYFLMKIHEKTTSVLDKNCSKIMN